MTERNLARTSLHVTLYERLVMIDNVSEVEAQKRALGLLGWNSRDAASILSIRNSAVWEPLLNLVQWPLLAAMASGTVVDWSVEYHAYPVRTAVIGPSLCNLCLDSGYLARGCFRTTRGTAHNEKGR